MYSHEHTAPRVLLAARVSRSGCFLGPANCRVPSRARLVTRASPLIRRVLPVQISQLAGYGLLIPVHVPSEFQLFVWIDLLQVNPGKPLPRRRVPSPNLRRHFRSLQRVPTVRRNSCVNLSCNTAVCITYSSLRSVRQSPRLPSVHRAFCLVRPAPRSLNRTPLYLIPPDNVGTTHAQTGEGFQKMVVVDL